MRQGWPAVVVATLLLLAAAPPAHAEHNRYIPTGANALDATVSDPNFVVHYKSGVTTTADAEALLADMAESHAKLVAGGGGTPNAGLNPPIDDSDTKTDVYMSRPNAAGWGDFIGGVVFRDDHGAQASYVFMTPDQSRAGIRFRSAHEYMHVIQAAYFAGAGLLTESTANWASEWALSDVNPLDSNFGVPHLPLDCSYGSWNGTACANGYRQWPFMWRLTQLYGADLMDALLDRMAAICPPGCSPSQDRQILEEEIIAQSGGADTLSEVYGNYARAQWDPARWQTPFVSQFPTTAMQAIHDYWGLPVHTLVSPDVDDTGTVDVMVDHLAARYVLYRTDRGYEPSGPDDEVQVTVTWAPGLTHPFLRPIMWGTNGVAQDHPGPDSFTLDADPATLGRLLLPLVNDSYANGKTFSYRIRTVRGTPAPPANDTQGGAVAVARNATATTNNVYAGGRGNVTEGTGCPFVQDATRGVWFRFTADADAVHSFDASASDFNAVISVYHRDSGQFYACSGAGQFNGFLRGGETYDVYVGRWADEQGYGTQARLSVTGPDALLPEVNINTPANNTAVGTNTPTFSGNASNRFGDSGTVRINLWAGTDTSGPPTRTFTAPKVNTSWSTVAEFLPNGVYTWRAELDGKAGTGLSPLYAFTVRGPATGPPPVVDPPPGGDD
ncbi:MAG: hypothetical protein M3389_05050, partial [Actinomycetota bacterium]|nr:hypothetical protein [Actinomycetota bacterium]